MEYAMLCRAMHAETGQEFEFHLPLKLPALRSGQTFHVVHPRPMVETPGMAQVSRWRATETPELNRNVGLNRMELDGTIHPWTETYRPTVVQIVEQNASLYI